MRRLDRVDIDSEAVDPEAAPRNCITRRVPSADPIVVLTMPLAIFADIDLAAFEVPRAKGAGIAAAADLAARTCRFFAGFGAGSVSFGGVGATTRDSETSFVAETTRAICVLTAPTFFAATRCCFLLFAILKSPGFLSHSIMRIRGPVCESPAPSVMSVQFPCSERALAVPSTVNAI
jgi:hypothetical protein